MTVSVYSIKVITKKTVGIIKLRRSFHELIAYSAMDKEITKAEQWKDKNKKSYFVLVLSFFLQIDDQTDQRCVWAYGYFSLQFLSVWADGFAKRKQKSVYNKCTHYTHTHTLPLRIMTTVSPLNNIWRLIGSCEQPKTLAYTMFEQNIRTRSWVKPGKDWGEGRW